MSMRAISRTTEVSFNTIVKMLEDAGMVCAEMHDEMVRDVNAKRVQCDEIWAFNYCKQRTVASAKAAPADAGDIWTWTGIDADSKLIISYLVGDRSGQAAIELNGRYPRPHHGPRSDQHGRPPRLPGGR
jgi:hypothetical protein